MIRVKSIAAFGWNLRRVTPTKGSLQALNYHCDGGLPPLCTCTMRARTFGSSLALFGGADPDAVTPAVRNDLATLLKGWPFAQRCASSRTTQQIESGSIYFWSRARSTRWKGGGRERETVNA